MDKVLILGSTGMLGQALFNCAKAKNFEVYGMAETGADFNFDIRDDVSLEQILKKLRPDIVINTVALVSIEKCEKDPGLSYLINSRPASILASVCSKLDSYFVHVSTDHYFVDDGNKKHTESSKITLVNEYARSKYAAEKFALTYSNSLVLRTNIVGFRGDAQNLTFVEWVINSLKQKAQMKLFVDFFTSSIDVKNFAEIFFEKICDIKPTGTLNFASSDVSSKKDFIFNLSRKLEFCVEQHSTDASLVNLNNVARAESLGLDVSNAEKILNCKMPNLEEVINSLALEYMEKSS